MTKKMRTEGELTELLHQTEEAIETNKPGSGLPAPDDLSGWGFGRLGDADELRGLAAGLRYALGIPDTLADGLSEKGANRWLQDSRGNRAKMSARPKEIQQIEGQSGGQNV